MRRRPRATPNQFLMQTVTHSSLTSKVAMVLLCKRNGLIGGFRTGAIHDATGAIHDATGAAHDATGAAHDAGQIHQEPVNQSDCTYRFFCSGAEPATWLPQPFVCATWLPLSVRSLLKAFAVAPASDTLIGVGVVRSTKAAEAPGVDLPGDPPVPPPAAGSRAVIAPGVPPWSCRVFSRPVRFFLLATSICIVLICNAQD